MASAVQLFFTIAFLELLCTCRQHRQGRLDASAGPAMGVGERKVGGGVKAAAALPDVTIAVGAQQHERLGSTDREAVGEDLDHCFAGHIDGLLKGWSESDGMDLAVRLNPGPIA